jgi:ribonucleotide reductase beta subunit family protein with ferritin-like domain
MVDCPVKEARGVRTFWTPENWEMKEDHLQFPNIDSRVRDFTELSIRTATESVSDRSETGK